MWLSKSDKKRQNIEALARSYYLEEGLKEGRALDHWVRAEKKVEAAWRRDQIVVWCWLIFFVIGVVIGAHFGYLLESVFWISVATVIGVTFYVWRMEVVRDDLFAVLRATFMSLLAVIPVFTFSFQYWPTFKIDHDDPKTFFSCSQTNDGNPLLPSKASFHIKNQSNAVVRNAQVRYWFVMKEQQDQAVPCTLDYSASKENFSFGPQEERAFLFSFGKASCLPRSNQTVMPLHHLHLIVQLRYRPFLFPFVEQKIWSAFHYAPDENLWSIKRKDDRYWKNNFEQWYKWLDATDDPNLPPPIQSCAPTPKTNNAAKMEIQ